MAYRIGDELKARALWFTAPRTPTLRAETVASPGPGEVRVKTIASAVSAGTEMLVYPWRGPADLRLDLPTLAGSYEFPIKYGYAAAGRVLDTGPGVERLSEGRSRLRPPSAPGYLRRSRTDARATPEDLDPVLGVFSANLETALNIVHDTPVRLGETALVFGQGVVGILVALLLKLAGAGPVLVVDPLKGAPQAGARLGRGWRIRANEFERTCHRDHGRAWG